MIEELSNSDLRAVANARATRKFFSRRVLLYIVFTGMISAIPNIWYDMSYLPAAWIIIWYGAYAYVTSKVGGKIYRRLLEMRALKDAIEI